MGYYDTNNFSTSKGKARSNLRIEGPVPDVDSAYLLIQGTSSVSLVVVVMVPRHK